VSVVVPGSVLSAEPLRRAFDRTFATPTAERAEDLESFLTLRIGSTGYAMRVLAIAGLTNARRIVPLAGARPAMLGLTAVRGRLFPVYSLEALVGEESASAPPRWFVLCAGADPLALGFAQFEGHVLLPRSEVFAAGGGERGRGHVRELLRAADEVRAVIDTSSLVEAIRAETIGQSMSAVGPLKER
jgi:chemotaxis signal transduction protein